MHMPSGMIPVVDLETHTEGYVLLNSPEWQALLEWVTLHGLDPNNILARPGITRDATNCCIRYVEFVRDPDGNRMLESGDRFRQRDVVEQGEAPPFPFPDLVRARLRPRPAVAP
jgi:hypothetical protein